MAVILEPRSFSIATNGSGVYRSLDPDIHLELSSTSFRIEPGDTHYVFYRAKADKLPAWFTISSTFSAINNRSDMDVRILLPHTVYIYPKKNRSKTELVEVKQAAYQKDKGKIVCEIANRTVDLERVEEIRVSSGTKTITSPGFPLLPGAERQVEMDWKEAGLPEELVLHMERSTLKLPVKTNE